MRPSLLLINTDQFGYHSDSYKYCYYLKEKFDITYLCFDAGQEKQYQEGVRVIYVSWKGNYFKKGYDFIRFALKYIKENEFDFVFMLYFPLCFMVKVFTAKNIVLDIRTGSVNKSAIKRTFLDTLLRLEALYFKDITIISKSLSEKLGINKSKIEIIPLGSDIISKKDKNFDFPRLFYVGTLYNRNIHETIIGLKRYIECNAVEKVTYDIFGFGTKFEEDLLNKTITENRLNDIVKFHGRKTHREIQSYFDDCNIGVSYVPITKYFDCQPPTKTYEYVNSGMICIATDTFENRRLINENNGILCKDTAESFSLGLSKIFGNMANYHSADIRNTLKEYSWETTALRLDLYLNRLKSI